MGNLLDVIFDVASDLDFYAIVDVKALPEDIENAIKNDKKTKKKQQKA